MESEGDKPFLPAEIIINILKRLPVKFILRFRSVCKDWKNLFKTPHFIAQHSSFSAHQNPLLLLHETDLYDGGKPPSLRLVNRNMETVQNLSISSIHSFKHHWSVIGSCNGLVCVRVHNFRRDRSSHKLFLWNPAIRDVKEIPLATRTDKLESCTFGFGFSSVVNDYKIVKFYKIKNTKNGNENMKNVARGHDGVEVYSLNKNSWKELEIRAALKNTTIKSKQVSIDGTIFWFGAQQDSSVMVSFDIGTQVFTLTPISLPFEPRGCPMTHLCVYQNKFAIFHHYFNNSWNFIDIGVMEDVAGESGKSFSCTDRYEDFDSSEYRFDHLLCIWRDHIVFREPDEFRLFNVTTQEWKDFPDSAHYDLRLGVNYEESLVSVWNT